MSIFKKTKSDADKEIELYQNRRKLEVDESVSEWRRSQKNRAVEDVIKTAEESRIAAQKLFKTHQVDVLAHTEAVAARTAELAALDAKAEAKRAILAQVEKDYEGRGILRDRACKAEKASHDAVITEKDKHIAHLTASLKDLNEQHKGLLSVAIGHLGKAADKDAAVTKVVGFGQAIDSGKK
jgi:hypothetical protein